MSSLQRFKLTTISVNICLASINLPYLHLLASKLQSSIHASLCFSQSGGNPKSGW
jgi:hypothetical protein